MENFENEKIKIKIRAKKLIRTPVWKLALVVLQIPPDDIEKAMIIFRKVSLNFPVNSGQISGNLIAIFPAFLSVLDGNFSEDRVEFLAEFLLKYRRD